MGGLAEGVCVGYGGEWEGDAMKRNTDINSRILSRQWRVLNSFGEVAWWAGRVRWEDWLRGLETLR